MQYTLYELFWLYFLYSFLGWCAEVALAAITRKKFINRGFVTGPLCPIYGAGAVAFAIFLPELTTSPVFLFLGSMILASGIEYFTGAALEKIFHKCFRLGYLRYFCHVSRQSPITDSCVIYSTYGRICPVNCSGCVAWL